jgi:hypothetical protein
MQIGFTIALKSIWSVPDFRTFGIFRNDGFPQREMWPFFVSKSSALI